MEMDQSETEEVKSLYANNIKLETEFLGYMPVSKTHFIYHLTTIKNAIQEFIYVKN